MIRTIPLLFLCTLYLLAGKSYGGTFEVDYPNRRFLKDGKPYRYIGAEIHYFRIHPEQWLDRLQRIRAAGLNVAQVYIAWNMHEPYPGTFDFSGGLNITRFFSLAQSVGLDVLLRIGPFIDGEHENGALPWWLLKYPGMKLRTSDPNYENAIRNWFGNLSQVVVPLLYKNGGPILMVQAENEYGNYNIFNHVCFKNYTAFVRDVLWEFLGNDVVLYTNSGTDTIACGNIVGTLNTLDKGPWNGISEIENAFQIQRSYNNNSGPSVDTEYYPGWFASWGGSYYNDHVTSTAQIISNYQQFYSLNASWSTYMFYGGTNFGFQNEYKVTTSYDYRAPISENGDITDTYKAIRTFIQNLTDWNYPPQDIPANNPMANYGTVQLQRVGTGLISTLNQILEACHSSNYPMSFEDINHGYGFVLYTTTLGASGKTLSTPNIRDFGYVFLNNVYQGMLNRDASKSVSLNNANSGDVLRILVENGGRQAYSIIEDYKSLFNATLDGNILQNWIQCGVNLTESSVNSLTGQFLRREFEEEGAQLATSQPGVFVGQFSASVLQDTFFDSTGLGKGQLFINGFNLGRYWPGAGPQITLYVPKPIIQANNTVLLIELIGAGQTSVNFINHTIWSR